MRTKRPIPSHPYHELPSESLRDIATDAKLAAKATQDYDAVASCKYLDQMNDAVTVLAYRKRTTESPYNRDSVQRLIDKDPTVSKGEAKTIHRLLAGWRSSQ
jgi:hypothetical protein